MINSRTYRSFITSCLLVCTIIISGCSVSGDGNIAGNHNNDDSDKDNDRDHQNQNTIACLAHERLINNKCIAVTSPNSQSRRRQQSGSGASGGGTGSGGGGAITKVPKSNKPASHNPTPAATQDNYFVYNKNQSGTVELVVNTANHRQLSALKTKLGGKKLGIWAIVGSGWQVELDEFDDNRIKLSTQLASDNGIVQINTTSHQPVCVDSANKIQLALEQPLPSTPVNEEDDIPQPRCSSITDAGTRAANRATHIKINSCTPITPGIRFYEVINLSLSDKDKLIIEFPKNSFNEYDANLLEAMMDENKTFTSATVNEWFTTTGSLRLVNRVSNQIVSNWLKTTTQFGEHELINSTTKTCFEHLKGTQAKLTYKLYKLYDASATISPFIRFSSACSPELVELEAGSVKYVFEEINRDISRHISGSADKAQFRQKITELIQTLVDENVDLSPCLIP